MQQYATERVAFESDGTHCGRPGHAVLSDPALSDLFRNVEQNAPSWRNRVTPRFFFNAPRYRDGTIERIAAPLMVTVARDDEVVSSAFVKEKAARAKHHEIREYPVHHFEMYHGAGSGRGRPVGVFPGALTGSADGSYTGQGPTRARLSGREGRVAMKAKVGDWLVMKGFTIDKPDQRGLITEVHSADGSPPYVVHWLDSGHVATVFPGPDAIVITAAEQEAADERAQRRIASVQSGLMHRLKSE